MLFLPLLLPNPSKLLVDLSTGTYTKRLTPTPLRVLRVLVVPALRTGRHRPASTQRCHPAPPYVNIASSTTTTSAISNVTITGIKTNQHDNRYNDQMSLRSQAPPLYTTVATMMTMTTIDIVVHRTCSFNYMQHWLALRTADVWEWMQWSGSSSL